MARNRYYASAHWRALRSQALDRDGHRCQVPGCNARGTHVDHIRTRPNTDGPTPLDVLGNLRTLCAEHDGQIKERSSGKRGRGGKPIVKGFDERGNPIDPNHPWNR